MPAGPGELRRNLIHAGSSIIPLGYWLAGREVAVPVLAVVTVIMILAEILRIMTGWGADLYQRYFGSMTRREERKRPTGATYLLIGNLLAAILFPPTVAILAMLFLTLGDSAAAFVGQRYGRTLIGHKSLEGTLTCFIVCLLIALPAGVNGATALIGATVAALAELIPWTFINDNIAIPLFSGAAMTLMLATGL
ncbi:MAG: hypothetical protein IIB42_02605 [Candidatus Marinimicrobia bacterium]|nr:hypothetical protein [Candidatus Neomarinimicrobiota bacterium]